MALNLPTTRGSPASVQAATALYVDKCVLSPTCDESVAEGNAPSGYGPVMVYSTALHLLKVAKLTEVCCSIMFENYLICTRVRWKVFRDSNVIILLLVIQDQHEDSHLKANGLCDVLTNSLANSLAREQRTDCLTC